MLDSLRHSQTFSRRFSEAPSGTISFPKNRSTGNLYAFTEGGAGGTQVRPPSTAANAVDFDSKALSPILSEHEHGLGVTGLRRIRQQPISRAPTQPPSPNACYNLPQRSASMTLDASSGRTFMHDGLSSPTLNFGEDLSRFPSESLHSFSFSHQTEDVLHNRQNLLKRSVEFLQDKLGWASNHPELVNAQAKVNGDAQVQNVMQLLAKASVLGDNSEDAYKSQAVHGSLTRPTEVNGPNIFEKAFIQSPSQSAEDLAERARQNRHAKNPYGSDSSLPEPSLGSDVSAPDSSEPRSPPNEALKIKPPNILTERGTLKRSTTDASLITLQTQLVEVLARPYVARESIESCLLSPASVSASTRPLSSGLNVSSVHGHAKRWSPATQAVFTTEAQAPWTILAANDLACLVFGVTKAEVKKLGILEVVREDRRGWLEDRLGSSGSDITAKSRQPASGTTRVCSGSSNLLSMRGGVTAQLLSKPSSRQIASQRSQSNGFDSSNNAKKKTARGGPNHHATKSRGVLLCGDIVPIQKRNGNTGSASLWVKEKRGGLIWVLEEIMEDVVIVSLDEEGRVVNASGANELVWAETVATVGLDIRHFITKLPFSSNFHPPRPNFDLINETQYYTAQNGDGVNIPASITADLKLQILQVSSFPNIAGMMVLAAENLRIISSNSVFSAALFGYSNPDGLKINQLIPRFDRILEVLIVENKAVLTDGLVIPEHAFRRARALLALREGNADVATVFSRPAGLVARHRDGSDINVDIQMRVVRSEKTMPDDSILDEEGEDASDAISDAVSDQDHRTEKSKIVLALWVTYSRQLHSAVHTGGTASPSEPRPGTPRQPSSGQLQFSSSPQVASNESPKRDVTHVSSLTQQIREAASEPISNVPTQSHAIDEKPSVPVVRQREAPKRKRIADFKVLEDMGQGAYGEVKLAANVSSGKRVVLKYVIKRRILVDTWTRDRRLGTVPLEIHVLDYLRKDDLRHPNIVEMTDFFEDDINYYIEMVPHGLPGMDLFDYIEMRPTMDETECRNIFLQVVSALYHLHTKALVVHRDIKDENIVLDGENNVKLIDFGSAAYIKNGPFNVFVGTIGKIPFTCFGQYLLTDVGRLRGAGSSAGEIVQG